MEAIEFMKNYFSNHPKKQPSQREEEFCRYLCRLLKKIKLEITFEKLELEIILLVNKKIDEERNFMETNNYCSPNVRTISSSTPPSLTTSSSDSSNLPSPSTYQRFNYPQTIEQPSNFEPTSVPIHIKNKPRYTTSHPKNPINTPSPTAYPLVTDSPTYFEEQINLDSRPSSYTSTPLKKISPSPLTNNQFSSFQYNKSNPLIITSRSQNPNINYKNPINTPSPSAHSLPFITDSPTYLDEHINLDIQPPSFTSTSNPSKRFTCIPHISPSTNNQPSSIKYIKCKPIPITSRSQNSNNTYNSPINTPSPPEHPNFINSPIYHTNPIPIRNQTQSQSKPVILEQVLIKGKTSPKPKSILDQAMDGVFEDIIIEDSEIIL